MGLNLKRNAFFHIKSKYSEFHFKPLKTYPTDPIEEMKIIFENITIDNLKFVGIHASNYFPINGTLQKDRQKMLDMVNSVLETRDETALKPEHMRGL